MTVTPDASWFMDPARAFLISVDPVVDFGVNDPNSYDAYTQSDQPNGNFNSSGQFNGSAYVDRAGLQPGVRENTSEILFNTSGIQSKQILNATYNAYVYGENYGANPLCIYPNAETWSPSLVTWNTRPNHFGNCNVATDTDKVKVSPALNAANGFDITGLVQKWSDGRPNYGMTLDTAGLAGRFDIGAFEQGTVNSQSPTLHVTYNTLPPASQPSAPANGNPVMTPTPTLTSSAVVDAEGDPVKYWYRVSNSDNPESGQIVNSGWQSSPSWTIPDGSLIDGVSYSWYVLTWDGNPANGTIVSPIWKFKVNLRLGQQAASPMDSEGPVGVNLANGNVTTSTSSPSFSTVGGDIGLSYTYNSKAQSSYGLRGRYYDGCGANGIPPAQPNLVRTDPRVDFAWGDGTSGTPGNPGGGINNDNFCAQWDGFISVPRANRCFDAIADDGIKPSELLQLIRCFLHCLFVEPKQEVPHVARGF